MPPRFLVWHVFFLHFLILRVPGLQVLPLSSGGFAYSWLIHVN